MARERNGAAARVIRRLLASAALTAGALASPALAAEIEAASRVTGATLYPSAATVERSLSFEAPAGRHEIIVSDLPLGLDADSLRVEGAAEAPFTILGLNHRVDQPGLEPLSDAAREALQERIRAVEWDLRAAEAERDAALDRLDYMREFRKATLRAGGREEESAGLISSAGGWTEAWALMSAEIEAAGEARRTAGRRVEALEEDLAELQRELDRAGPPPPARGVVTVSIAAETPIQNGRLVLAYLTREASWSPLYDLRLETAEETAETGKRRLRLIRRAAISQTTGEDWPAVRLRLSTARPSGRLAAEKPPVTQAVIAQPRVAGTLSGFSSRDDEVEADRAGGGRFSRNLMEAQTTVAPGAPRRAEESGALASYDGAVVVYTIEEPVRAPGDGEVRQARIGEESAMVETVVRATPSIDPTAYLYAAYRTDAPLLPGRASLYRDGVYFGQFGLSYVAPGDLTALPFGPLESVVVTRVVKDRVQGEEGIFRSSNKERSRFALTAKNLGDAPVKVTLFDSMPFSETEEIEVAYVGRQAPTESDVEGRRGALAWTFDLAAKSERVIDWGYDIGWPDGKAIQLR